MSKSNSEIKIKDGNLYFKNVTMNLSEIMHNTTNSINLTKIQANNLTKEEFELYARFRNIITWISLVIIIIGLVGNLTSFIILINPKMRISTNVFLSSLCVSGFIALFGLLINSVIYELLAYYGGFHAVYYISFLYPYIYPIITTFQMASILLTVCVSVNQFIFIYFSRLRNQSKNKKKQECKSAFKVVILMYCISILYCIPYWLKYKFSHEYRAVIRTDIGQDELFNKIVHFYMYLPIAYIIPFSILIFTNAYLIGTIAISRKRRIRLGLKNKNREKNNSSNSKYVKSSIPETNDALFLEEHVEMNPVKVIETKKSNDYDHMNESVMTVILKNPIKKNGIKSFKLNLILNKPKSKSITNFNKNLKKPKAKIINESSSMSVTIMLIAVVFLFFICQFPALILHIIESMICSKNGSSCAKSLWYLYSVSISKLLLIANLSLNFVCYCLFSKKFRSVLKETFTQCSHKFFR